MTAGQLVSRADIDAGQLEYTPPADESGDDVASFTFKVSDGTVESESAHTMTVNVDVDPVMPPGRPKNLAAIPGHREVVLSWDAPSSPGGSAIVRYEVRYAEGSSVPSITAWQSVELRRSHTVTGLTNEQLYTFEVRAVNSSSPGEGPASDARATPSASYRPAVSIGDRNVPEDIGTAVVTVTLDRPSRVALSVPWVTVDHTAVSPDDYTGGEGTLTFAPGDTEATISIPIVDDAVREDPVDGYPETFLVLLLAGEDYRLHNKPNAQVSILDNDGDGPVTGDTRPPLLTQAAVNGTTLVLTYDEALDGASVPAAGDFVVTVAGSTITVNGVSVAGAAVTLTLATAVEANQAVVLDYTPGANPTQDAAGNDAAAVSGQPVTHNTAGPGPPPPPPGPRGPLQTVPDAPTNLLADGGNEQVTLSWDATESDGGSPITGYQYRIDGTGRWISIGSAGATHTVTGLINGTTYVFQVRAVNAAGNSAPSNRARATPRAPVALDFAHFANGGGRLPTRPTWCS